MLLIDRQSLFAAAVSFALITASCGSSTEPVLQPNVVVIVLEGVRADHLSSYGYGLKTTPNIDALAKSAVRYTRCRSTSPWTLASQASILTGLFTYQHGAHPILMGELVEERPLDLGRRTLAEALGDLGYRRGAFVSDAEFLKERYQLDQGFEDYVIAGEGLDRGAGTERNRRIFDWLKQTDGPFFLYVSYGDARPPFNTLPLGDARDQELSATGVLQTSALWDEVQTQVLGKGRPAPEVALRELQARYDLGLANADIAVGELIERLRADGRLDNTLLIVTSDHGVYFGEHGLVGSSRHVYEEALHVPLICKLPGEAAGRVDDALRSVADIPGLVAQVLPEAEAASLRAEFPLKLERESSMAELYHSRSDDVRRYGARFHVIRRVFYEGNYKLIRSSDASEELYDLQADPHEQTNLAKTQQKLAFAQSQKLIQFLREHPVQELPAPPSNAEVRSIAHPADLDRLGVAEQEMTTRKDD